MFQEGNSSFLLGLVCLLFGFGKLAWYANLFHFGAVLAFLIGKAGWAASLSVVSIGLALTTFGIVEMPRNEGGQMTAIVGYHVGYYLWVASMVAVLGVAVFRMRNGDGVRSAGAALVR